MRTSSLLLALCSVLPCADANAQVLPCGIRDFRVEGATIKVFFSESASWRVGSRGDRIVGEGKNLYFDTVQQDDVVVEEEAMVIGDGLSVGLSIPHIGCTLTAVLGQPVPGLSVRQYMTGFPGVAAKTDTVFLPVAPHP